MEHPAVAQVVTFAVPHAQLGEDIAAANSVTPECFSYGQGNPCSSQLRDSPILRYRARWYSSNEIPKGATGKVQRIGLAEKLGLIGLQAQPRLNQAIQPLVRR